MTSNDMADILELTLRKHRRAIIGLGVSSRAFEQASINRFVNRTVRGIYQKHAPVLLDDAKRALIRWIRQHKQKE